MTDFRVGDKVMCLVHGDGIVKKINLSEEYPIVVNFEDCSNEDYTLDGKLYKWHNRTLYHAGTKITIEEAKPERWPWINVYRRKDNGKIRCGDCHNTKDSALASSNYWDEADYLFTIQLKPMDELNCGVCGESEPVLHCEKCGHNWAKK